VRGLGGTWAAVGEPRGPPAGRMALRMLAVAASELRDKRDMPDELAEFADRQPSPIPLQEILEMRETAELQQVLQQELPVRLANRIAHLDSLPDLDKVDQILAVRANFVQSFREIREASKAGASPEALAQVIKALTVRHEDQASRITFGMREWRQLHVALGENEAETWAFVDGFLDRIFLSWIGMSTLTAHYLELFEGRPHGVVDTSCSPYDVARSAANVVENMAQAQLRTPPRVEVSFHGIEGSNTLPLIPTYLFYIMQELLKNSVRAAGERHEANMQGNRAFEPPPVIVRVSSDSHQVALQIFDRGGGIPFERQSHVWSYMYSTAKGNRVCQETGRLLEEAAEPSPLAGFGVGLPLSRLYAEYIGGSLHLMSMPNFGTYAYLFLKTSHQKEEALPTYVNWLRKRQLRDRLAELERRKTQAAEIEEYFEAARLKALAVEARAELALLERDLSPAASVRPH